MIRGVPYDAEVEYLESTGTQWIDTGISAQSGLSAEYDIRLNQSGLNGIGGYYSAAKSLYLGLVRASGNIGYAYGYQAVQESSFAPIVGRFYKVAVSMLDVAQSITIDGQTIISTSFYYYFNDGGKIYLFAINNNAGADVMSNISLKTVKIYLQNTLVRDLIPVRVGTVGYMYDRVTKRLFGNQGTGAFTIGPDVAKPVMGLRRFKPTSRNYVQDGLVAMWDGIENAGWGVHDTNATVWKDLVGNRDFTIVNPSWRDTGLFFGGDGTTYGYLSQSDSAIFDSQSITISAVITRGDAGWPSDGIYLKPSDSGRYGLAFFFDTFAIRNIYLAASYVLPQENSVSVSVSYDANTDTVTPCYGNTICGTALKENNISQNQTYATIGKRIVGTTYYAKGSMRTLRVYNRALTADEIAANYAIDKVRFNLP